MIHLKKHLLVLLLSFFAAISSASAQSGVDCNNAIPLIGGTANFVGNAGNEIWFSYTSTNTLEHFQIKTNVYGLRMPSKIEGFTGNCSSLNPELSTAILNDTLITDTINQVYIQNIQIGQQMYIKLTMSALSCSNCFLLSSTNLTITSVNSAPCPANTHCARCEINDTICDSIGKCELVCNGLFDSIRCQPSSIGDIDHACSWDSPTNGLSSLFSSCSPSNDFQTSVNIYGCNQNWQSNCAPQPNCKSYAGFTALPQFIVGSTNYQIPNERSYIRNKLQNAMYPGNTYRVSFWVSLSDFSYYNIKTLGVRFEQNNITYPINTVYPSPPQLSQSSPGTTYYGNSFVPSHLLWTNYSPTTIHNYMIIGNFLDDSQTQIATGGTNGTTGNTGCSSSSITPVAHLGSYYFVDSVSVRLTSISVNAIASATNYCLGSVDTITLTAQGAPNNIYSWTNGTITLIGQNIIIPAPTVNTTWTVTAISPDPCNLTATSTVQITVFTGALPTLAVNDITHCASASNPISLTATTNATNLTWSNSTLGTFTGNPANVLIPNVGTYTFVVTAYSSQGCIKKDTITVTTTSSNSIQASNINVCGHLPFNICATGAIDYTWTSPSAGIIGTTNCITYTLDTTTTFTITGTDFNGCLSTGNVTVNVVPSTFVPNAITATSLSSCTTIPQSFNAPGGYPYYNWVVLENGNNIYSTSNPNNSITINWGVSNPIGSAASVTVYYTNNTTCFTSRVDLHPCCEAPTGAIPSQIVVLPPDANLTTPLTHTNKIIVLNGTVTTTAPISLNNCKVFMGEDAKIILNGSSGLNSYESHFLGCPNDMWDGIYAESASNQITFSNTNNNNYNKINIVEDAKNGLISKQNANLIITHTYFNKNLHSIKVLNANNSLGPISNHTFRANIFTSRNINTVAPLASLPSTYITTVKSNYHYGSAPATLTPITTIVKPDYAGFYPLMGIYINTTNNVGSVKVGDYNYPNNKDLNYFDNLRYGIKAEQSNVEVYNNDFKLMQYQNGVCGNQFSCVQCEEGTAICIDGQNAKSPPYPAPYKAIIGSNQAVNTKRNFIHQSVIGVNIVNHADATIINNRMDTLTLNGIRLFNTANVATNNHYIYFNDINAASLSGIDGREVKLANVFIRSNNINKQAAIGVTTLAGIAWLNAITNGVGQVRIKDNFVQKSNIGIGVQGQGGSVTRIDSNRVFFSLSSVPVGSNYMGVYVGNSTGVRVGSNNIRNTINLNPTSNFINTLRGVVLENTTRDTAYDNNILRMGSGIYCLSTNTNNILVCNTFNTNYHGVYFGNTSIGDQLLNGAAQSNRWLNHVGNTRIEGVITTGQIKWYTVFTGAASPIPFNSTAINPLAPTNSTDICNAIATSPNPSLLLFGNTQNLRAANYQNVINDNILFNTDVQTKEMLRFHNRKMAHRQLKMDNLLNTGNANSDAPYIDYVNDNFTNGVGKSEQIDSLLNATDSLAVNKISSFAASNQVEELLKSVYDIYSTTWLNEQYNLSTEQIATLTSIADMNMHTYGQPVYIARAMLNYFPRDIDFDANSARLMNNTETEAIITEMNANTHFYPNPTNQIGYLSYSTDESSIVSLKLYSIDGKLIFTKNLASGKNIAELDFKELSEGMYFYEFYENNNLLETKKIAIIK